MILESMVWLAFTIAPVDKPLVPFYLTKWESAERCQEWLDIAPNYAERVSATHGPVEYVATCLSEDQVQWMLEKGVGYTK